MEPELSPELQSAFLHFLTNFPPKYFSRNLRDMFIDFIELNRGLYPHYLTELSFQLSMFYNVLDIAEDEGKYDSKDYERNR